MNLVLQEVNQLINAVTSGVWPSVVGSECLRKVNTVLRNVIDARSHGINAKE